MTRIFAIDDSAFVLKHISQNLSGAGYEVESAQDWVEVRQTLKESDPFDLVLLDVNLEGMQGGDELALSLTHHPTTENAKVVLFSGQAPERLAQIVSDRQLDGYIVKGGVPEELLAQVVDLIGPPSVPEEEEVEDEPEETVGDLNSWSPEEKGGAPAKKKGRSWWK